MKINIFLKTYFFICAILALFTIFAFVLVALDNGKILISNIIFTIFIYSIISFLILQKGSNIVYKDEKYYKILKKELTKNSFKKALFIILSIYFIFLSTVFLITIAIFLMDLKTSSEDTFFITFALVLIFASNYLAFYFLNKIVNLSFLNIVHIFNLLITLLIFITFVFNINHLDKSYFLSLNFQLGLIFAAIFFSLLNLKKDSKIAKDEIQNENEIISNELLNLNKEIVELLKDIKIITGVSKLHDRAFKLKKDILFFSKEVLLNSSKLNSLAVKTQIQNFKKELEFCEEAFYAKNFKLD